MFDRFTMDNGLMMVGENIPHFRSVAVGLWVRSGSVNETPENNGYSHFIEHMLFKGTKNRSARQIAEEMDAIGGQMNAFTSKECTCYYVKVMDEHLERAMDLISDLALNSTFDQQEMDKEKNVICEEISMVEDTPEDLVHELLAEAHFGDHPLGRTILGPSKNIQSAGRDDLLSFKQRFYGPNNAVLSVAGHYEKERVQEMAQRYFGVWERGAQVPQAAPSDPANRQTRAKQKPIEQTHLCVAFPGIRHGEDDAYVLSVLNNMFGGGMSSRLFQRIREENGMAYSVYSYPSSYLSCGLYAIYAGTSPRNAQQVIDMIGQEIRLLLKDGVTKQEFAQAKEQLKGSFILGQEATSSRMSSIGRGQLLLGRMQTEEEALKKIENVTIEDVMRLAGEILTAPYSSSVVGPKTDLDFAPIGG